MNTAILFPQVCSLFFELFVLKKLAPPTNWFVLPNASLPLCLKNSHL